MIYYHLVILLMFEECVEICRKVDVVDLLLKMGADVLCADHEGRYVCKLFLD